MHRLLTSIVFIVAVTTLTSTHSNAAAPKLQLNKGDKIVYIGNTLAERMQNDGFFEAMVQTRYPQRELTFRNLGWSADELTLRPRSKDFQDHGHRLIDHKPDVIFAFFGFNESFAGEKGLPKFKKDLEAFIKKTTTTKYNSKSAPKLVLVSPIAHENLHKASLPDGKENNKNIALYTKAMKEIADKHQVIFLDIFSVTQAYMKTADKRLTNNGIHLNETGNEMVAALMDLLLFGSRPEMNRDLFNKVRKEVVEKNLQHWYDYRAVNGFYIYGGRKKPFGVVNFPAEFKKLRKMVVNRDHRIWKVAKGNSVPDKIDDSNTGNFADIKTNFKRPIKILSPAESKKHFKLPKGYEINLFASEIEFPALKNPCQFAFDAKGRLWVVTMETYPMYLPGTPVHDKILILEDTNGDGKADKSTVFADGLHLPTGIELGDGGAYVAQQPDLVFLKDTDGDDKADVKKIVLHGFDSADSHHSISAFEWGPGGALYFQEGTFHHSQIETPYGPTRLKNAGIFRYEPKSEKLDVFVSYNFANPWGHLFDKWGQNLVADASGGANYFGTAFSGDVDYPRKHAGLKHFLKKQWRPTSGCELVSSKNFPDDVQGNYLLNNCIGFHGVLQYKMKDDGSGFHADPVEPLVQSTDTNFRPVDLQFGPDGALYLVDWFNPLVGHMQHSIRDPNRDHSHGRIWRVHYKERPLVKPAKIAGEPIPKLLDLLKSYEDRTRFRVRRELRLHNTNKVVRAIDRWVAKLDKNDKNYQHHLLEALWVNQHHDVVDQILLKQLLKSSDYRVRAASTRVLCYWRDRVKKPLDLLRQQVNDKHPRVRIEAIRALSFFKGKQAAEALEVSVESLLLDQDYYLKYTLQETMNTLEGRVKQK